MKILLGVAGTSGLGYIKGLEKNFLFLKISALFSIRNKISYYINKYFSNLYL